MEHYPFVLRHTSSSYLSLQLLSPFLRLSGSLRAVTQMLHSDTSHTCCLTFEECGGFFLISTSNCWKMSMRALTVSHLLACSRFSPTRGRTQSPLRWIALPLPSLSSLPVLLLTSWLASFSLPSLPVFFFFVKKEMTPVEWPEPNVPLKAEELWENIEIYGEKDVWRLEDYLMVIIAPFCCISALL